MRVLEAVEPSLRIFELKHLPGRHAQATHGRGSLGPTTIHADSAAIDFIARGQADVLAGAEQLQLRGEVKAAIVREISPRVLETANLVQREYLAATGSGMSLEQYRSLPLEHRQKYGETVEKIGAVKLVQSALNHWASSSNDIFPESVALQIAAQKEFKVGGLLTSSRPDDYHKKTMLAAAEIHKEKGSINRLILRQMYNYTQEEFAKAGITEVVLHRGIKIDNTLGVPQFLIEGKRSGKVGLRAMSSFSADIREANLFAEGDPDKFAVVMSARVPVSRIISTARTGLGALPEYEYVVLGETHKGGTEVAAEIKHKPRIKAVQISDDLWYPDDYAADWLRTRTWDLWHGGKLVETLPELQEVLSIPIADFMHSSAAQAMPDKLRQEIAHQKPAIKATGDDVYDQAQEHLLHVLQEHMERMREEVARRIQSGEPVSDAWIQKQLTGALEPELTNIALESVRSTVAGLGVAWDAGFANEQAVQWSKQYTFDLVKGLVERTRELLQKSTADFFATPGATIGDLQAVLEPAFGKLRSRVISVTETTRAFSAGKQIVQEQLKRSGIQMEKIWQTLSDEIVCPICGPRNEQPETKWPEPPPAHPNCRCSLSLRVKREE